MLQRLIIKNIFFFFNDTATTEIYTLSLHDALPICTKSPNNPRQMLFIDAHKLTKCPARVRKSWLTISPNALGTKKDRKSTRLNSSHANISYAVFCLKKKKHINNYHHKSNNANLCEQ